ncbi:P12 family lipoprotein [Borrelia miyamotoi]|uniref:P12 family lipoprotein n=1 Tax=Borrelia miyamotoi TaxID=47466 RepID=A0AAQ2WYH5_9SPIR|nr:P12 family lipoprotein [Borrelia miyamotoi]AOW96219.1 hypothetical protein AXH25_05130 [Borrelia miyamotoi]QTL84376.1 P12 family lipoprotein [Borrelia miyamotoi]WAZ86030.1 P12 family lipoprotein [Borrelia miyamotoi]WAZ91813.1 P12 family lipoprotein [Borrelia miyamotoi]WAZ93105.1 P12 family lipoprotein [Borrelia miyamotoi]
MKKSILAICMLILLSLLSCDINVLNEMLIKAREKYVEESKKAEDLNSKDGNQEGEEGQAGAVDQEDIVGQHFEERVKQVMQAVLVDADNAEIPVILHSPYYPQQEEIVKIEEKDLIPSTNEEKEAQAEIDNVKSALGDSGFAQLIEKAHKLKDECEQLESSFYDTLLDLNNKIRSYSVNNKRKGQKLIQVRNQLNEERSHIDRLRNQVDSGLYERTSSKYFFEKSQETLKEAITERLKNVLRSSFRRVNNYLLIQLSRQARRNAENALSQLESSSAKLNEAMGIKKEIEVLIEEAKSVLVSFER